MNDNVTFKDEMSIIYIRGEETYENFQDDMDIQELTIVITEEE